MAASFGWGTLAASSLVIGAVIALRFRISLRAIGLIMGFGAGVLISALSFDLIEEAVDKSSGHGWVVAGLFAGCLVFFGGDRLIDHLGGSERKDATGDQEGGSSLAIVLGTVLDGIPESMVIGFETSQRFPRAGSQSYPSPAATANADGSTTITFGPERPADSPEENWIQTTEGKGWFPILRLYSPLQSFFDKSWQPSELEPLG